MNGFYKAADGAKHGGTESSCSEDQHNKFTVNKYAEVLQLRTVWRQRLLLLGFFWMLTLLTNYG